MQILAHLQSERRFWKKTVLEKLATVYKSGWIITVNDEGHWQLNFRGQVNIVDVVVKKEYDDDVSDVYQQHSCHRRSSVAEVNNSSIIISHLDIRHGNTCAELEFPSPISSVIKRCQICKSASTAVSKKVICYIQIVYEKRSLNVSKRSGQLSFPT
ncbi:Nuclease SbcCD subunit [Trichinella spiralis]